MRHAFGNDPIYKQKQSEIVRNLWRTDNHYCLIKPLEKRHWKNARCSNIFEVKPYDPKKFCSHSCYAYINNLKRRIEISNLCLICKEPLKSSYSKFCSTKCQSDQLYNQYISSWKLGLKDGNKGIIPWNIPNHIRRYLLEKYQEKCSKCGRVIMS